VLGDFGESAESSNSAITVSGLSVSPIVPLADSHLQRAHSQGIVFGVKLDQVFAGRRKSQMGDSDEESDLLQTVGKRYTKLPLVNSLITFRTRNPHRYLEYATAVRQDSKDSERLRLRGDSFDESCPETPTRHFGFSWCLSTAAFAFSNAALACSFAFCSASAWAGVE